MSFLGIGPGKMDLQLSKNEFVSGEKIEGTATLTLNKDINAKGVIVEIWGERWESRRSIQGPVERTKIVVYKFTSSLDGERAYTKSESPKAYKFSLDAPDVNATNVPALGGDTGKMIMSVMGALSGVGPVMWFVEAKLVMPLLEFGASKKQQISIASAQQGSAAVMQ